MAKRLAKKVKAVLEDRLEDASEALSDALTTLDEAGLDASELYSKLWSVMSQLEELTP
jgi:uncharacterized protein (UPF0147 family)